LATLAIAGLLAVLATWQLSIVDRASDWDSTGIGNRRNDWHASDALFVYSTVCEMRLMLGGLQTLSTLQVKMQYRLDESTRNVHDTLASCQTKVSNCIISSLHPCRDFYLQMYVMYTSYWKRA